MKKIKQKLPAVFLILLAVLFIPGVAHAKEFQGNLWNFKETIKKTSGAFTYYAYPSKNQKEAWIYKISIKGGKDCSKLSIPSKLDNKNVTCLGNRYAILEHDAYNIFGMIAYPSYPEADQKNARVNRIKKLVIPDTVKTIRPAAFCSMDSIKTVKIPKSVKVLDQCTFYHCDNLKKIELPAGLKKLDALAFLNCPNLTDIKLPPNNKTYQVKKSCVITKKKKELVCALADGQTLQIPNGVKVLKEYAFCNCAATTVHIPASVKKIRAYTFSDLYGYGITRIEDVTVDTRNSVYARDGQCIYNKIDKSLSIAIWDERGNLYISDKVERLTGDKCSVGPEVLVEEGKVVYPKNLKTILDYGFFRTTNASKIYFTGEKPPEIVLEKGQEIVTPPVNGQIYVPEGLKKVYRKWYKKYYKDKVIPYFNTFKPEEKI